MVSLTHPTSGMDSQAKLEKEANSLKLCHLLGPVHTGCGGARKCCLQKMEHIVPNGSVHTALPAASKDLPKNLRANLLIYASCVNGALAFWLPHVCECTLDEGRPAMFTPIKNKILFPGIWIRINWEVSTFQVAIYPESGTNPLPQTKNSPHTFCVYSRNEWRHPWFLQPNNLPHPPTMWIFLGWHSGSALA